jgi:hypothetical protein
MHIFLINWIELVKKNRKKGKTKNRRRDFLPAYNAGMLTTESPFEVK